MIKFILIPFHFLPFFMLPLSRRCFFSRTRPPPRPTLFPYTTLFRSLALGVRRGELARQLLIESVVLACCGAMFGLSLDRKSTRLNSSHLVISYAVFCLKKKI